jgi:hypothetical protein
MKPLLMALSGVRSAHAEGPDAKDRFIFGSFAIDGAERKQHGRALALCLRRLIIRCV